MHSTSSQLRRPLQPETLELSFCLEHSRKHVQQLMRQPVTWPYLFFSIQRVRKTNENSKDTGWVERNSLAQKHFET